MITKLQKSVTLIDASQIGMLVPIDIPGNYTATVGDMIKVVFSYPIYPTRIIRGIKIIISDSNLAILVGVLQIPPEKALGTGAIAAMIMLRKPGVIKVNAMPVDMDNKDMTSREINFSLTILEK